ncbi:MAG TPA: hypothetical protein VEH50_03780 [Methylomirabilota bacterium]|nr:hypothetical protein [Methylomirabilota bacterium]
MANRRKTLAAILIPVILGLVGLLTVMQRPRFQAFRTVDVVQLVASGMCLGVALVGVVAALRGERHQ